MQSITQRLARHEELFRRSLLLTALMILVVVLGISRDAVIDPDLGWHLRTGEWILAHGAVQHTDFFSAYGQGKPWVAYSWLYEVILYGLYASMGLVGMIVFTGLMTLAIALALMAAIRQLNTDPAMVIGLTAVGLVALSPLLITPRPWLFSILFYIIEISVLLRWRRTGSFRQLASLPLLFMLWANLHLQFLYGIILLCGFFSEPMLRKRLSRVTESASAEVMADNKVWLIAGACILATLITPYHLHLYPALYDIVLQAGVYQYIAEMQAMNFRTVSHWVVLLLTMGAAFSLGKSTLPLTAIRVLFVLGLFVAFRAQRDVWFLVAITLIAIASTYSTHNNRGPIFSRRQIAVSVFLAGLAAYALVTQRHIGNPSLQEEIAEVYPQAAVYYVRLRHLPGPLYNHYDWGGYLIWKLPEYQVNIDGRANLHGDERITRAVQTWSGKRDWMEDQELQKARLVIADQEKPLCALLKLDPRFEMVFEDTVSAVFIAAKNTASRAD